MATKVSYVWWVLMPPGSNEGSFFAPKIPATAKIFKVIANSSYDDTLNNGGTITISGKQWTPALVGNFPTLAEAKAAAPPAGLAALGGLVGSALGGAVVGATSGGSGTSPVGTGESVGTAAGAAANTGLTAIGDFFSAISSANTWVRVAKVLIGGTLLIVGLAKLTGAGGVAAKAVKYAPFL